MQAINHCFDFRPFYKMSTTLDNVDGKLSFTKASSSQDPNPNHRKSPPPSVRQLRQDKIMVVNFLDWFWLSAPGGFLPLPLRVSGWSREVARWKFINLSLIWWWGNFPLAVALGGGGRDHPRRLAGKSSGLFLGGLTAVVTELARGVSGWWKGEWEWNIRVVLSLILWVVGW